MSAQIGNLFNRVVTSNLLAADQAAGLAFSAVNIQTPGDKSAYITGIEAVARFSAPDTITNIRVQIFQNVVLLANLDINVQTGSPIQIFFSDTAQPTDRVYTTRFNSPLELDLDSRYAILAFPIFGGLLAGAAAFDLTVLGLYDVSRQGQTQYFGKTR